MKIIFVVTEASIFDGRGTNFIQSLNNFVKMFEDINILENSLALFQYKLNAVLAALMKISKKCRRVRK